MNRAIRLVMALLLASVMVAPTALGETVTLGDAVIRAIKSGDAIDLDQDGATETIEFETAINEDGDVGPYTLKVNGQQLSGEGYLTGQLYAMRLGAGGYPGEAFLLVPEVGPSDWNVSYIYRYAGARLSYVGEVPTAPESICIQGSQFTGLVRARALQTWFRPADFVIARTYAWDDDGEPIQDVRVAEVPRAIYPMGTVVKAKLQLTLLTSPTNADAAHTVQSGETVILTGSDDREWLNVQASTPDGNISGWLKIEDWSVLVGDKALSSDEVFDGLLFAG
ncbi:hypothetical protein ACH6CV_05865 [Bacillota bacterium Meth-B3]